MKYYFICYQYTRSEYDAVFTQVENLTIDVHPLEWRRTNDWKSNLLVTFWAEISEDQYKRFR